MDIPWSEILKIVCAFVAGALLGIEREYSDKPSGMRTIILITVGSALFSLLNLTIHTQSPDRIASTVVTGVRSEEHTSELQSHVNLVCRLLLEKKKRRSSPRRRTRRR